MIGVALVVALLAALVAFAIGDAARRDRAATAGGSQTQADRPGSTGDSVGSARYQPNTSPRLQSERPGSLGFGFGLNIVVVVIGRIIGLIGLIHGLATDAESAPQQTVVWVIEGLIGLLIAAVGIAGASVIHTMKQRERG